MHVQVHYKPLQACSEIAPKPRDVGAPRPFFQGPDTGPVGDHSAVFNWQCTTATFVHHHRPITGTVSACHCFSPHHRLDDDDHPSVLPLPIALSATQLWSTRTPPTCRPRSLFLSSTSSPQVCTLLNNARCAYPWGVTANIPTGAIAGVSEVCFVNRFSARDYTNSIVSLFRFWLCKCLPLPPTVRTTS